eukprot:CAMPEP_0117533782 /NCGR_PEP_ID=MMETSP0784-20121206/40073_1 /TAXON_ID=39447 /ORGANISM="" /LENGTH=114 /DNA_ID=CAMNT_0005330241 /DNA_START=1 /DNA_END=345 /DNA_ORIENTATION=+
MFFPAGQLFVVPVRYFLDDGKDDICHKLSNKINFKINCKSHGKPSLHEWQHSHPRLEEDTSERMRAKFNSIMDRHKHLLVSELAKAHSDGAHLARYMGAAASTADVLEWLESGW